MTYESRQTEEFKKWRETLRDERAKAKIRVRIGRAETGNFGDWKTEQGEVKAMRIDYGPGYRLYYVIRGGVVIFLLCGGDKRTENADIRQAVEIAKEV
ncbi:MAG: type II toxin-antitoxin system RelE/ParE family toxin [Rickettsiales bacterium]|jgi:putative addiction module killer protein|nr:type II toxin-antitoxin system RelE/ParE family toxin [Rickettsiales bacterium]